MHRSEVTGPVLGVSKTAGMPHPTGQMLSTICKDIA